jgi:DNA-binding transcriptional LysR family regulator
MHLRYFCKLAETQHYTLAASELFISQPGLSGAISSLEQELGIPLFEKKGRNIHLTKYGKEFYNYVNESLNILDKGIAIAYEHSGKLNGTIDIGSINTIQSDYLPSVLCQFHAWYPKIQCNICPGESEDILHALEDSTYDIGFCSYNKPHPDMTGVPILHQEVVAAVHKGHPLAQKPSLALADLADYNILCYSRSQQLGQQFYDLLKSQDTVSFSPKKLHFNCRSELYMAGLLMQNAFRNAVGLIAKVPQMDAFPDIICIPIEDVPADWRTVYMVYNHQTFNTHAITLFIDFIKEWHSLLSEEDKLASGNT